MPARARGVQVETLDGGVGLIRMGGPAPRLDGALIEALDAAIDEVQAAEIRGVVIAGGDRAGFPRGPDEEALLRCGTADRGTALARAAQRITGRVADLDRPTVAAIRGDCLGAGLELALACDVRVAAAERGTRLGFPDVHLGLPPAAGGTQRLPRVVGVQRALDLLLTGRLLRPEGAREIALVDELAPPALVVEAAAAHARRLAAARPQRETFRERLSRLFDREELQALALAENPVGRKVLFDQAHRRVREAAVRRLPVLERLLEVVRTGLERGFEAGLDAEAAAYGELVVAPPTVERMRLAVARRHLDAERPVAADPRPVERVGILGAGRTGAGVAYLTAAEARLSARVCDVDRAPVAAALRRIHRLFDEAVERGDLTAAEAERRASRVGGAIDLRGFEACEVIIEAVPEDLDLKRRVLDEVEPVMRPAAVFASTAAALPVAWVAAESARPENVVGMHYLPPVQRVPLLEVVVAEATAPAAVATAVELGRRQGRTVVVVRDGVGFYTTRVLAPLLNEAGHLVAERVPLEVVDRSLRAFGFPAGPFELLDRVGIDRAARVAWTLGEAFGARAGHWPGLRWMADDGRRGEENDRGFYRRDDGAAAPDPTVYPVLGVEPDPTVRPSEDLAWRCVLRLLAEAVWCFGAGVVASARDGDVAATLGLGFPPSLGGPFRLVDALGPRTVFERLTALRDRHGPRFEPPPLLAEMVEDDLTFYGPDAPEPGCLPASPYIPP